MAWRPHSKAYADPSNPQAWGQCDRCQDVYLRSRLDYQFDWVGPKLTNLGIVVCPRCMDTPQEQLRSIVLPPDPRPVMDPRPQTLFVDDSEEVWVDAMEEWTLDTNDANWVGFTVRQVIPLGVILRVGQPIRLTLESASGSDTSIASMVYSPAVAEGEAYAYATDPVAVTVGGEAAFVLPAGEDVVTDAITAPGLVTGLNALVGFYLDVDEQDYLRMVDTQNLGFGVYYKAGDDVLTMDPSGYAQYLTGRLAVVKRIEVLASGG